MQQSIDRTREAVRITVPALLEYVRIVRLTSSGVANHLGFDVEEVEDLRVAVDELASLVLDKALEGNLDITFCVEDDFLRIEGRAPVAAGFDPAIEELTAQILAAVVDEYELTMEDGHARFSCARRLPAA